MTIPLPSGGIAAVRMPWSGNQVGAYRISPDLSRDDRRLRGALQAWADGLRAMSPNSRPAWVLLEAPDADEAAAALALRWTVEATTAADPWNTAIRFAAPVAAALQGWALPPRLALVSTQASRINKSSNAS